MHFLIVLPKLGLVVTEHENNLEKDSNDYNVFIEQLSSKPNFEAIWDK